MKKLTIKILQQIDYFGDYVLHNNFHFSCKSSASEVFDYLDDKEIFAEATEDVQAHQLGKISNKLKFIL